MPEDKVLDMALLKLCPAMNCLQSHWVSGLSTTSGILNIQETSFRKLDLLPSSEDGKETVTLFGPLERANLTHCFSSF
jgi:hypothetical protein